MHKAQWKPWVLLTSVMLASCGGGGASNSSSDRTAPVVSSVGVSRSTAGQITLNANATDDVGVVGYCFKSATTAPQANDACFQTSANTTVALPQSSAMNVWAKDKAGNISVAAPAGCSVAGVNASQASALPTVCVSTSLGQLVVELESTKAPVTVTNFLKYVNDGFYSQTVFHRVLANFMVQGGGFTAVPISSANAKAGTVYPAIVLEAPATTGLSNTTGAIAMARTSDLNSATSQFFINVVDNASLDTSGGGYAVFGRVIYGMDTTVQSIRNVPVQSNGSEVSQPLTPPVVTWMYALK